MAVPFFFRFFVCRKANAISSRINTGWLFCKDVLASLHSFSDMVRSKSGRRCQQNNINSRVIQNLLVSIQPFIDLRIIDGDLGFAMSIGHNLANTVAAFTMKVGNSDQLDVFID